MLLISIFAVKTLNHEVIKLIELDEGQDHSEKDHEALVKTPNITDPVQNTVHIPINSVQIQVELPRHLHVHIVWELIRPILLMLVAKDSPIIFRQLAELIVCVLQPQIRQLNLVNDLLTHLRIHGYVLKFELLAHLLLIAILARAEPLLVPGDHNKLALQPVLNLRL